MFSFNQLMHAIILITIQSCFVFAQDHAFPTLVTRLVHYLSIDSPYFDPNTSPGDLARIDLESSIFRAMYLTVNFDRLVYQTDILETQLSSANNGYFAHLQVGSRLLDQLVYMDTGSSLLWINCLPCVLSVPEPIFDPKQSSSFEKENCTGHELCDASGVVQVQCQGIRGCIYNVLYFDGHYSRGPLARESFKFGRSHQIVRDILFGCSRNTNFRGINGILGLSVNGLSFLAQRNTSKFAYCLGNVSDKSYPYNTLVIGDKIDLLGYKTTLIQEGKYFITLEHINIGNKALDIDPQIFKRNSFDYSGGMLVDTGSTYTFFPLVLLKKFEAEIINLIGSVVVRNFSITYKEHTMLCYNGIFTRDITGFPVVQLQFQGNAIMELAVENVFYQYHAENFCLAILPSEILPTSFSILGNVMQQNFYIAYDIKASQFAFQRMECDVIDDYVNGEL